MKNLGQELTDDQLKLMIREADCNGDGVIDFEGKFPFYFTCTWLPPVCKASLIMNSPFLNILLSTVVHISIKISAFSEKAWQHSVLTMLSCYPGVSNVCIKGQIQNNKQRTGPRTISSTVYVIAQRSQNWNIAPRLRTLHHDCEHCTTIATIAP